MKIYTLCLSSDRYFYYTGWKIITLYRQRHWTRHLISVNFKVCNSYTMACPPVRGDNPQALALGLSYVQVDKHGITVLYHLHQCNCDFQLHTLIWRPKYVLKITSIVKYLHQFLLMFRIIT